MRVEERTSKSERIILSAMITNTEILAKVAPKWNGIEVFGPKQYNLIAKWCIEHFAKYGKAPNGSIEAIYAQWVEKTKDVRLAEGVEIFLEGLSQEYETENPQFVVDSIFNQINLASAKKLHEELGEALEDKDIDRFSQKVSAHKQLTAEDQEVEDLLTDPRILNCLDPDLDEQEIVIQFYDALGQFFEDTLARGAFIAFEGIEKIGKSFWLLHLAWTALEQRRKVAYFEVGDLGQRETIKRFCERIAKRPLKGGKIRSIKLPQKLSRVKNERGIEEVVTELKKVTFDTDISRKEVREMMYSLKHKKLKTNDSYFKLRCHPTKSITAREICSKVKEWRNDGWIPDVVIVDYADILEDPPHMDKRHAIEDNWGRLRSMALEFDCLVLTASQASAKGYKSKLLGRDTFTEDKRKRAHTTGTIGINQTEDEKKYQLQRLNWIVRRRGAYHSRKVVYCAGCLGIANPAIITSW